jgi:cation:H+ antiporter
MNMDLVPAIAFVAVGFLILLYSGDCLVRGALAAANKLNVSSLLVGVLIVGFGTSMPEFIISLRAAVDGKLGLAHGAIVGSNIANIWLVIALPAVIFPISSVAPRMRLTASFTLLCTAAWIAVTAMIGLNPIIGGGFLLVLVVYAVISFIVSNQDVTKEDTPEEETLKRTPFLEMMVLILVGVVGLPLGSEILLDGGFTLAEQTDSSQAMVGVTLLAIGSSLPELGAGISAAFRKQSDVAMGNILGANIFNILGAGGMVAVAGGQQRLGAEFLEYSNWAMGVAALMITAVIFLKRKVGVVTAVIFMLFYAVYIFGLVRNVTISDPKCLWEVCGLPGDHLP